MNPDRRLQKIYKFIVLMTSDLCIVLLFFFVSASVHADDLEIGRKIYEQGILPSGKYLTGTGSGGQEVIGQEAACANCHHKSGMGGVEGKIFIPPISANFLFHPEIHSLAVTDPSQPMGITISDHSYTDSSLETLLTKGLNYKGLPLNNIMPRYQLDVHSTRYLLDYLHKLSSVPSEGVTSSEQHFATVFTPEVDDKTKQLLKSEIDAFVFQHNSNMSISQRHRRIGFERFSTVNLPWVFHYWDLKGDQSTWTSQLEGFYKKQPVFAFVAGVSFQDIDPIQEFCDRFKTPCLFRSVLYPPDQLGLYSVYFSNGLGLDSAILSTGLKTGVIKKPKHVYQIMSADAIGDRITNDFGNRLQELNITESRLPLTQENMPVVRKTLSRVNSNELVICWCDQFDLQHIGKIRLPKEANVYFSGSLLMMKSGVKGLPASWKSARLIYPYEEPDKRQKQLSSFYSWVTGHHFEASNEVLQSDTYISLIILQEVLAELVNNRYKDYLLERTEMIFGMSYDFWGMYSRPSLGTLQRYANKSGYITKFVKNRWVPESARIIAE